MYKNPRNKRKENLVSFQISMKRLIFGLLFFVFCNSLVLANDVYEDMNLSVVGILKSVGDCKI
jgi:hypothetical protein